MTDATPQDFLFTGAYSLHEYGAMVAPGVRASAYEAALAAVVRPDSVVVEIGAGAGFFSLLACRLGAARVYAIEPNPIVELVPLFAADNGVADRLVAIAALSAHVTLPERADILLADLRGVMPFYHSSVESIIDARDRFLKPGGIMIPARDTLWAGVAYAPTAYRSIVEPWTAWGHGLDLRRGRDLAVNGWVGSTASEERLISEPLRWGTLDYATARDARLTGAVSCTVTADSTAHGMFAWFDAELVTGIGLSNAPGGPMTPYGRAFFPWPSPHDLEAGSVVDATFHVMPGPGESVWTWETRVRDRTGAERAAYRQSTFLGHVFPSEDRRLRAHTHVPALSGDGCVDRDILAWIDGRRALGDIATLLLERYPHGFADWNAALERVADVSRTNERHDA